MGGFLCVHALNVFTEPANSCQANTAAQKPRKTEGRWVKWHGEAGGGRGERERERIVKIVSARRAIDKDIRNTVEEGEGEGATEIERRYGCGKREGLGTERDCDAVLDGEKEDMGDCSKSSQCDKQVVRKLTKKEQMRAIKGEQ